MTWTAPSEEDTATATLNIDLWDATARELETTVANYVTEILKI